MLQIVAQRGGFVHTDPPLVAESIVSLFQLHSDVLTKLAPGFEPVNLYYTLAHHSGAGDALERPARTGATFDHQTVLAWDIDAADGTRGKSYAECVAEILDCPVTNLSIVGSGNGVHVIVGLKYHIHQAKFFTEMKTAYKEVCIKIAAKMAARALPGTVDPSIFEPARVLRLPGTVNRKPDKEDKPCVLIQLSTATVDVDLYKLSGLEKAEKENISPTEVRRRYPQPDFQEVRTECRFFAWAVENVTEVHEPQAFDLFSLLVAMPPDARILNQGAEISAKELANFVFDNATASASLKRQSFDEKWEQAGRYGARKCETIDSKWGQCKSCPHNGKIPTPLALKSSEHIGTASTGYWVYSKSGNLLHPHYADLARVYKRDHVYVTTKDERIFSWTGKHYVATPDILVKRWMENTVNPSDGVKEAHRNEFLAKLRVCGAMTEEMETGLFIDSIRGKLSCHNGVVDIMSGELLPHAPNIGFQYMLPYEYHADLTSEFFLDWLSVITENRVDLMDSILDVMAYCLWPTFDDHVFVYLVGEGSNGKSTLIHILEAMMSKRNYSNLNIKQLTTNRFAPAALEGKLVNLSEESSGSDLSSEHLNVIKNLSAGGEMFIERKGEQGYSFRNMAKFIFSANKTPRFEESGRAIKRRLLTIPFDFNITDPDSTVEDKLIKEIPGILAMLVKRVQENVMRNGGRFQVSRNSQEVTEAQKKFLTVGNTTVQWAQECLESRVDLPNDVYTSIDECYDSYVQWCEDGGIKHNATKRSFIASLREHVITTVAKETEVKSVKTPAGWRSTKVFKRTRLIDKGLI